MRKLLWGAGLIAAGCLLLWIFVSCMRSSVYGRQYPNRIPIRFWHMWTAEWKDVIDRIVGEYNQSQDQYEVVALSIPENSANSKFLLAVAGGDPPDVMAQWGPVLPTWAQNDLILPLDDLMSDEEKRRYETYAYPVVKDICNYKGHPYAMVTGVNLYACYCRKDHLTEAGLSAEDFPNTMEELIRWGRKLDKYDQAENLTRIGFMPSFIFPVIGSLGGGFYDDQRQCLTLNTPQNLRALELLVSWRKVLGLENVLRFDAGLGSPFGIEWSFITGAHSIEIDGQWRVEQLKRFAPDMDYFTAPVPPLSGAPENSGWAYGNFLVIPRGAAQVQGAWEFIKFWTGLDDAENAAKFYVWGAWVPGSSLIAQTKIYQDFLRENPNFKTFIDLADSANIRPNPPVPYQAFLCDRINQAFDAAYRGVMSPAKALENLGITISREQTIRKELGYNDAP